MHGIQYQLFFQLVSYFLYPFCFLFHCSHVTDHMICKKTIYLYFSPQDSYSVHTLDDTIAIHVGTGKYKKQFHRNFCSVHISTVHEIWFFDLVRMCERFPFLLSSVVLKKYVLTDLQYSCNLNFKKISDGIFVYRILLGTTSFQTF